MPELPEVESARHLLSRTACGKKITSVWVKTDPLIFDRNSKSAIVSALSGRRVTGTGRRGKHFWAELDRRPWPIFHFGMSGHLHVYKKEEDQPKFLKMEWVLSDGTRLGWTDPRRFGRIRLVDDPTTEKTISQLGFDALIDLPPPAAFSKLVTARKRNLKALLLDQSFSAGVGNWVADEVLFQAKLSPHRLTSEMDPQRIQKLRSALKSVIQTAVSVDADSDQFPKHWIFHHRWSVKIKTLPNGLNLVRETVAGRTTAWVPDVQG